MLCPALRQPKTHINTPLYFPFIRRYTFNTSKKLPYLSSSSSMEWVRPRPIGRGSSATVSVATAIPSGHLIAVKSAYLSHSAPLQREQYVLSQLSCPRIVKYIGYNVTGNSNNQPMYNLCMEFVSGGTLSDEIQRQGGSLDEGTIGIYAHQVLQGLEYLHENGVVHCDIKSQNILIGEEGVKIADLGCAKLIRKDCGLATSVFSGTPAFMAPEVARGEEQGFSADIWALGCTIIDMATGNSPWPELNDPVSALYRIGFSGDSPAVPGWFSEKAKDFLGKCLERDVQERWTARELLEHPFLQGIKHNLKNPTIFMSSPSSVLDQGIWDSVRSPKDLIQEVCVPNSSGDSPVDRIKKLIPNNSSAALEVSSWSWGDEDWITIRGNEAEERNNKITNEDEPPSEDDLFGLDYSCEEDLDLFNLDEELALEYSCDFSSNDANLVDDFVLENLIDEVTEILSSTQSNHSCSNDLCNCPSNSFLLPFCLTFLYREVLIDSKILILTKVNSSSFKIIMIDASHSIYQNEVS